MTPRPFVERARPLRRLAAIAVLLAAVASTQAVHPAAQAQAAQPTISAIIHPDVVSELEAAGVTITASRGATVRREGDALLLSIPVRHETAVTDVVENGDGFVNAGDERLTVSLVGRITIANERTGRSLVLRDLQGVAIRGPFIYVYLNARTSRFAPRFRFALATSHPAFAGWLMADGNLVQLASSIADTPVMQNAIPNIDPPLYSFGYRADLLGLIPPPTT